MKKNILLMGIFIVVFLGVTLIISQKFNNDIKKNKDEIEEVEEKDEDEEQEEEVKKKTYKDTYNEKLKSENGKGREVSANVMQYLEITGNSYLNVDLVLLKNGEVYLGFPRVEDVSENIQKELEVLELPEFVTTNIDGTDSHTFIGKKILDEVSYLYHVKSKNGDKTSIVYIKNDDKVGVLDLSNANEGEVINTNVENCDDVVSIIESKNNDGNVVIAIGKKEDYDITEYLS